MSLARPPLAASTIPTIEARVLTCVQRCGNPPQFSCAGIAAHANSTRQSSVTVTDAVNTREPLAGHAVRSNMYKPAIAVLWHFRYIIGTKSAACCFMVTTATARSSKVIIGTEAERTSLVRLAWAWPFICIPPAPS